jgi:serine phosphatase RsbU (regulator of sigma subunit)
MTEPVQVLRVVVASPADVLAERDVVAQVVNEINKSVCADRGLRIEVIRWETDAYPGFHVDGPQGLIDPILRIENCDVLIGIFWKRFGTPTGDSGSGTAHEFQLAYQAWKKKRSPQVMVYFNLKAYAPQSKEETDQWGQVLEFRKAYPKEGLWWPYKGTATFGTLLRTHLTNFIRDTFPVSASMGTLSPKVLPSQLARDGYFVKQSTIIEEYTRTFVCRAHAQQAFHQFLDNQRSGYFIILGGPGQGKTAFLCHLVKEGGYVHHFISRTGGRSDPRLILRSLVSQLLPSSRSQEQIPESISDLTKTFEELLLTATANNRKTVVVIDALDELPVNLGCDPPYLIADSLSDGVFFVVTSRPGDRLDRFQERRFAIPQQIYKLAPLDVSEMQDILRSRNPNISIAEAERIAEASQGNPLYLCAVADLLRSNPAYDLASLPPTIEGFFRGATSDLPNNKVLGDVLAALSVARTPLSVGNLSQIEGKQQREIAERGIRPIRQFLLEVDGFYTFYHMRFHEFVTQTMLYQDELRMSHQRIADWLQLPANRTSEYRLSSLAHHLFESDNYQALTETIDEQFLAEKVRRLGYAVLEDIELWTLTLLEMEDPALVKRCVSLVDSLREIVGGDIIRDAAKVVQPYRPGPESFRTRLLESSNRSVPSLDVYTGILPKTNIAADFFEIVPLNDRFVLAIGDAPGVGLKSAFVARFLGNVFHKLVVRPTSTFQLAEVLGALKSTVHEYDYFDFVSMQCAEIDCARDVLHLVNAGHPYPVHYVARRGKCDILPLCGDLLRSPFGNAPLPGHYEEYKVTIATGDVVVFLTDGLTEDHVMAGDAYGYRFTEIIKARANEGARAIGEAILDNWKEHFREEDTGDDVSIIVVKIV